MSPVVVLAIVIATQNVDDQATDSMRATAVEALGSEDAVVVREVDETGDDETLRIERLVHAQTAALILWLDGTHTRARVRVHVADGNRWTERTIEFAIVDTPTERGRALGFAVTSMLPEETLAANPYRGMKRPADTPELRTAIRLVALGHTAVSKGQATGFGGSISGEFFVTPVVAARLGLGAWQGSLSLPSLINRDLSLSAQDLVSFAAVGVSFWPRRPSPDHRIAFGIRVDALLLNHSVTPDQGASQSKLMPGIDAMADFAFSVSSALDIVTSLGMEAAIGDTDLDFGKSPSDMTLLQTGTIGRIRTVGEVGIRLSF
jgi:hypothetical protein